MANMDGQQPDISANMQIDDYHQDMSIIKKSSLISEAMAAGQLLEEARSPAPRYAVENYFDEGRDHAHSLNYKRANYVNDDFVASSEAALFESGSAGASR